MARSRNPIGFTPLPVTILTSAIYIAIFAALLVVHHVLPSAPSSATPSSWDGVNITTASLDLKELTKTFHPYNSRANVYARKWLLRRIEHILKVNDADYKVEFERPSAVKGHIYRSDGAGPKTPRAVTIFDDNRSNATYGGGWNGDWINYFEGTNIMVYIRGTEDDKSEWWTQGTEYQGDGGVLVNAHYDSVSTGFGATDDGVGVVTVLQLISHFTTEGNRPKKGILALLNNGEEDGLYGAFAFAQHPMAQFPHAFLNLEGAGAGGRAALFRSTDAEVTKYYSDVQYPYGSVVSADGFKRGVIRSGTDYSVFVEELGMRGLDVAFMAPRARYHTSQDDARDTGVESLWHMLSTALTTVKKLSDDTSSTFQGSEDSTKKGRVNAGTGSIGVWFDLFGMAFAVLQLHTLFALSVTLLVAGPVLLIIMEIFIQRQDKWYLFARKRYLNSADDDDPVWLYGWKGFFRPILTFIVASAAVVALAFLVTKVNPDIAYSSEYAVWAMMLTAFFSVAWFLLRLGDAVRPSALSRLYALLWIYVLSWIALVAVTVGENQLRLASGYFVVVYNAAVFLALLISYLELFALPKKDKYVEHATLGPDDGMRGRSTSISSSRPSPDHPDERPGSSNANDGEDGNERTSLLNSSNHNRQRFRRYNRRSEDDDEHAGAIDDPLLNRAYEGEQAWSSSLPSWTWFLQFLLLAPINLILVGQIALLLTSGLHQTPADGNPVIVIYLLMAICTILLLLPLTPFLHRIYYQIPTFFFLIFIGTLVYVLLAFPFSRDARLKVYFAQQIDLDNGNNSVALTGLDAYIQDIVAELPSASTTAVSCSSDDYDFARRNGLTSCVWPGLAPAVVPSGYTRKPGLNTSVSASSSARNRSSWLDYTITAVAGSSSDLVFDIRGTNTRACRLVFDTPVTNISIAGAGSQGRNFVPDTSKDDNDGKSAAKGTKVKLWSREWDGQWSVRVSPVAPLHSHHHHAEGGAGANANSTRLLTGRVSCAWSDVNQIGLIPAFDEVVAFMPVWSAVSKGNDALVEGYRSFAV